MKTTKQIVWASLVCAVGLTLSCMKEAEINEKYRPAGSEIVFGASTGYQNGDGVRTEYSGATSNVSGYANPFERIDWVSGDDMTIYYRRGSTTQTGVYGVTGTATASDEISEIDVDHTSGVKLTWASGSGDHEFFAMYPANTAHNSLGGTLVQGTIPGSQAVTLRNGKYLPDMEYGYMVGYAKVTTDSPTSRVTLPFTPAMTAFEFKLKMAEGSAQVTQFKLESSAGPVSGSFEFNATGGTDAKGADWWNRTVGTLAEGKTALSSTGTSVTVTFPSGGATMSATQELDFTFFALPVDLNQLTVTLTYSIGSGTPVSKKLDLKTGGSWKTFDACKKYIITNTDVPGEDWKYFLDPIEDIIKYGHSAFSEGFTVHSYRTKGSTTENVSWAIKYSADGTSWSDNPPAGSNATVSTGSNPTAGYSAGHSNTTTSTIDQTGHTDILRNNTVTSSATAPYDLSMHTVQGGSRSGPVTANSYIVKAPGYYMFPLVYGNSIDATRNASVNANTVNGGNRQSYAPTSAANSINYLTPFLNVNDQGIRYPNILKDLGIEGTGVDAVIVWQDVPSGFEIIQESSLEIIDAPANAGVKNCKYIKFQVEQARITQGNILIALRDASDQIVWSWHIWVTDESMALIPLKNQADDWTNVMPVDVGWCDIDVTRVTKYVDRDFYVKVYQTGDGTEETTFHVIQYGESTSVSARGGSSTYYQWGRKDPFLPSDGNRTSASNKNYTSSYGITTSNTSVPVSKIVASPSLSANRGISHPYVAYYFLANDYDGGGNPDYYRDKYSLLDWFDGSHGYDHYNLWDTNCQDFYYTAASSYPSVRTSAVKSIYDPCPPQFRVPTLSEIDNISMSSASYQSSTSHWDVYCNGVDTSNGVFVIPWQCYRQASGLNALGASIAEGGLDDLGVCFYMSSTPFTGDRTANIGGERVTNIPGFGSLLLMTNFYGSNFIQVPIETYPNCGMFPVRPVAE